MSDALPTVKTDSAYSRLKRRHQRFVDHYVIGEKATDAIRAAGCKSHHARNVAARLLQRPEIRAAVEERTEFFLQDTAARKHKTLEQVIAIAYCDPRKVVDPETGAAVPLERMDPATAAAISSVEVENISINGETGTRYKYRFWDKGKALAQLGQWQKLWDGPGAKVNVDARSINVNATGEGVLRAVDDLVARAASVGVPAAHPASDPHGPVLPAPVCDEPIGRGASVDAGEDSRGPE